MTQKYCPSCGFIRETKTIPFTSTDKATTSKRNWKNTDLMDEKFGLINIQYFVRNLRCLFCSHEWITYEIQGNIITILKNQTMALVESLELKQKEKVGTETYYLDQIKDLNDQMLEKDKAVENLEAKLATIHSVSKLLGDIKN